MATLKEMLDERDHKLSQGNWVSACNRTEIPFLTRSGYRLLYCYQSSTGKHAYLNCDTDMILTDDEAARILSKY